jgi:hypothetical protein
MPEQIVDAFVLSWHHDHLSYQSHGKKKQYHRRERNYWLGCPTRLLSVDRFLDSRCQSRLSSAW